MVKISGRHHQRAGGEHPTREMLVESVMLQTYALIIPPGQISAGCSAAEEHVDFLWSNGSKWLGVMP